ncbi:MAG: AbrB family transcriptional regulator [Paracoccaceae bacterium]|nr:MAG: AbrB family transcriptional regulator [Paracoccaceae bacterium]
MPVSSLPSILLALALGALGGTVFWWLTLPLPWMLGALSATLVAAVAGAPIRAPERWRDPVVVVIGVLLGSGFSPELIGQVATWAWSLAALALYLAIAAAIVVPFYARVGRFDRITAYYAGMPGGLAEMMMLGRAAGGDDRKIILAHAARIVVTVAAIAFWFRVIEGQAVGSNPGGQPLRDMASADIALLVGCGLAGAAAGRLLRLPAPMLVGPMILSGAVHLAGLTHSAPPGGLVIAAQVMLGTIMGCRFIGTPARAVARALMLSAVATLMTFAVALVFAVALRAWAGLPMDQVVLAYAPGGLTEMSLVALAIHAEVAFVALHHVVRIVMVVTAAPLVLRFLVGSAGR